MAVKRRRSLVPPVQLGLFTRKPPSFDEAKLIRRLEEAVCGAAVGGGPSLSRAAIKRLMTPLPAVTVPRR